MAKIKIIITDTLEKIGRTGKTEMRNIIQEFLKDKKNIKILESGVSEMESINGIRSEYDYLIVEKNE